MFRRYYFTVYVVVILMLAGCTAATPQTQTGDTETTAAEETTSEEVAPEETTTDDAPDETDRTALYNEALQCVQENFPASIYMTNEFIPDPDEPWTPMECDSVDSIEVGMPWIMNDEEIPWYIAVEEGYFEDVCLDVELVPGGPAIDHLQTLAGGAVDIAVVAAGSGVPAMRASRTSAEVVVVATLLKHSAYGWLGIDESVPQDQPSEMELTPEDFEGTTIGLQPNTPPQMIDFLVDRHGIDKSAINVVDGGFTPDPVLMGAMDYIGAWIVNQPRLLEEQGYNNWVFFPFSEWGWDGYADVTVVRQETIDNNPDMVRRFVAAQQQGVRLMLENPERAAEIAVKYGIDVELTEEQAMRRMELQEPLVIGSDGQPPMFMDADRWNEQVALMAVYASEENRLEIPGCEELRFE